MWFSPTGLHVSPECPNMLAFLPHSADASSSTIREKEDSVAILSGEQQENMPAGLGAWVRGDQQRPRRDRGWRNTGSGAAHGKTQSFNDACP